MRAMLPLVRTGLAIVLIQGWFGVAGGTALALDPTGNAVADAFIAAHESGIGRVTAVGNITEADGEVKISRLQATIQVQEMAAGNNGSSTPAGEFTTLYTNLVIGAGAVENGILTADEITAATTSMSDGTVSMVGGPFSMRDVRLAPGDMGGAASLSALNYAREMTLSDMAITGLGEKVADVGEIRAVNDGEVRSGLTSSVSISDIRIETALLPPEAAGMMAALNLLDATGSIDLVANLNSTAQTLALESMKLAISDGATLNMAVAASGLDIEQLSKSLLGQGDPDALMRASSGAALDGFAISLTDDGLRERALGLASAMMGTSPDGVKSMAAFAVAAGLSGAGLGDLANDVSAAVTKFLGSGGTISVNAAPTSPLDATAFGRLAQSRDPAALVRMLNLTVAAE